MVIDKVIIDSRARYLIEMLKQRSPNCDRYRKITDRLHAEIRRRENRKRKNIKRYKVM